MSSVVRRLNTARHPIRRRARALERARLNRAEDNDWKLFLLSFAAFFTCFYTFLL